MAAPPRPHDAVHAPLFGFRLSALRTHRTPPARRSRGGSAATVVRPAGSDTLGLASRSLAPANPLWDRLQGLQGLHVEPSPARGRAHGSTAVFASPSHPTRPSEVDTGLEAGPAAVLRGAGGSRRCTTSRPSPACPASGPAAPRDYKARGPTQPGATRARSGGGGATAPRTHAHTSTSFAPVCVSAFFLCMRRGGQQSAGAAAHRGVNAFRARGEALLVVLLVVSEAAAALG